MKVLIAGALTILVYLKLYRCEPLKLYSHDGNTIRHGKLKHILYNANPNNEEFYGTKSTIRVERSSPDWEENPVGAPPVTTEISALFNASDSENLTSQILELKSDIYNLYQMSNKSAKNVTLDVEGEDFDEVRQRHPKDESDAGDLPELDENISNQPEREDIVSYFLKKVESQHTLGGNCEAGTELNLGEGVVDRYAQERFRVEADVAVNRANMLTRLWKYAPAPVMESEYLLHAGVISMVEFDDDIFAAGNCYDENQYKGYRLFCPYAYRLPEGPILAKDLAVEYKYLSNTSEWFYIARKNAENVIRKNTQFRKAFNTYTHKLNATVTAHTPREHDEILVVTYEDGKWSKPYYDCGGGNIWMLTYTVPFFGYGNSSYFFKGTSGIDIDLRRVDIDQCPLPPDSTHFNIFAASDKCKKRTTECVSVPGLGFRRGSYKCVCKKRFYFPDTKAADPYFNGSVIEEEYEKLMMNEDNDYNKTGIFECLPCAEGCEACKDGRPCVVSLNWMLRAAILILSCAVILCLPVVVLFTWKYRNVKVIRAASPVLLRVIALGAFFIYVTTIVMYPVPNVITCTARVWLREIGFMLVYGALMLKTWRISVIFRVRSAKAVKITDMDLLKRLGMMLMAFSILLLIRTLVAPPTVIVGRTAEDLKAYLCSTDWWDHSFSLLEVMFLIWGIRLCIVVRKAPSEFNESRFISMAIYNEFLLSVFLNVSMLFLQSPANPDLLYIIFFCHTQLTVTLLLCLIFGSKAYMVLKGHGKSEETLSVVSKSQAARFMSKPRSTNHSQSQATNNACTAYILEYSNISDHDIQEEFRRLYKQLGKLREENMRQGNRHLAARISAMQEAGRQGYADDDILEEDSSDCILTTELYVVNKTESVEVQVNSEDIASASTPPVARSTDEARSSEDVSHSQSEQSNSRTAKPKTKTKTKCSRKLLHKKLGNSKTAEKSGAANAAATESNPTSPNSSNNCCKSPNLKSGHAKTHAIVINLDDKNRFTEEVTV